MINPLIHSIDWAMLREQQQWLMSHDHAHADGLLMLIDHLQDYAVDNYLVQEEEVFGKEYHNA